jgi:hypothetical protein
VLGIDAVLEYGEHRGPQQVLDDLAVAAVVEGLDLDLARGGAGQGVEVGHPGHDLGLAGAQGPAGSVGDEGLEVGDGEPHRHTRALVDVRALAGQVAEGGHDLGHVVGDVDLDPWCLERTGLLLGDLDLDVDVEGVVGADLGAEAVLQRGDEPATVGVVLGVGRGEEHHVEGEADLVAPDLHVALLEHVEQADLDALGEVGQLVDGEDAPVGAGHQAVVEGELVGQVAALGDLDGVDLADEIGDGGVGGGQLLAVALVAMDPVDGVSSPRSATRSLACRDTGWYGSSLISEPSTMGIHSSSRPVRARIMRVLAWPRSPRKITSWPARRAFSSWGRTVSS